MTMGIVVVVGYIMGIVVVVGYIMFKACCGHRRYP